MVFLQDIFEAEMLHFLALTKQLGGGVVTDICVNWVMACT